MFLAVSTVLAQTPAPTPNVIAAPSPTITNRLTPVQFLINGTSATAALNHITLLQSSSVTITTPTNAVMSGFAGKIAYSGSAATITGRSGSNTQPPKVSGTNSIPAPSSYSTTQYPPTQFALTPSTSAAVIAGLSSVLSTAGVSVTIPSGAILGGAYVQVGRDPLGNVAALRGTVFWIPAPITSGT